MRTGLGNHTHRSFGRTSFERRPTTSLYDGRFAFAYVEDNNTRFFRSGMFRERHFAPELLVCQFGVPRTREEAGCDSGRWFRALETPCYRPSQMSDQTCEPQNHRIATLLFLILFSMDRSERIFIKHRIVLSYPHFNVPGRRCVCEPWHKLHFYGPP